MESLEQDYVHKWENTQWIDLCREEGFFLGAPLGILYYIYFKYE